MPRARSALSSSRSNTLACMLSSKISKRALPRSLARYIAMSALRSSTSASDPRSASMAMPTLAEIADLLALDGERSLQA